MPDSWINSIPSHERERIRMRMRSPEAYEKLREKVKGPEDLEKELKRNEAMAELHFGFETEPRLHDALKNQVEKDLREQGIEGVLDLQNVSAESKKAIESGKFTLTISSHPTTHHDALAVIPEGNVQEKIPVKPVFTDRYLGALRS